MALGEGNQLCFFVQDGGGFWDRELSVLKPRKSCSNWDTLVTLPSRQLRRVFAQFMKKKKSKTDGQEAKSRCPSFNKNKSKKKNKKTKHTENPHDLLSSF